MAGTHVTRLDPIRILIVEDHDIFAYALGRALDSKSGFTVVGTTGSAKDVVALALQSRPDVVLMDYQLPDGTGIEATRELIRSVPTARVVMLTVHADEHLLHEAMAVGAAGYIVKSGTFDELLLAVRVASEGGSMISPAMTAALLDSERRRGTTLLSAREHEILVLLALGQSTKDIAATLQLRTNTVRNHVQNILTKIGAHSRLEAIKLARDARLID
jgi:DNA-binding NarL/FixJ family response regulator